MVVVMPRPPRRKNRRRRRRRRCNACRHYAATARPAHTAEINFGVFPRARRRRRALAVFQEKRQPFRAPPTRLTWRPVGASCTRALHTPHCQTNTSSSAHLRGSTHSAHTRTHTHLRAHLPPSCSLLNPTHIPAMALSRSCHQIKRVCNPSNPFKTANNQHAVLLREEERIMFWARPSFTLCASS